MKISDEINRLGTKKCEHTFGNNTKSNSCCSNASKVNIFSKYVAELET